MNRLAAMTTTAERTLLALATALVLTLHGLAMLAPAWLVQSVPLAPDVQPLLPAAQIVLLAGWAVLGPGPLWLRLPATPVLLLSWAVGWTRSMGPALDLSGPLWLSAGALAVIFAVGIRCCGIRSAFTPGATAEPQRHPQFSIRALIILTTLIAAGLGILEGLRPWLRSDFELSQYLEQLTAVRLAGEAFRGMMLPTSVRQLVLAAAVSITALAALWTVLRPGPIWLRLAANTLFTALLGLYLANLTGLQRQMGINLSVGLVALTALVGLSALPLRLAGLRLTCDFGCGVRGLVTALGSLGLRWGASSPNPKAATSRRTPNLKEAVS